MDTVVLSQIAYSQPFVQEGQHRCIELFVEFDAVKARRIRAGQRKGFQLLMVIDAEDGEHKIGWRLAGVISEGKSDYDYIVATRADGIQNDGRIIG